MTLQVASTKITGTPGSGGWACIYEFAPEGDWELSVRGRLSVVFGASGEESVEMATYRRNFLSELGKNYYSRDKASAFNSLSQALEEITPKFGSLFKELEIVAASYVDGVVYSASVGGGKVALIRGGSVATILESTASSEQPVSASGYPREGDILVLGTNSFFREIPPQRLKDGAEKVTVAAANIGGGGRIGAAVLEFHQARQPLVAVSPFPDSHPPSLIGRSLSLLGKLIPKIPERKIYVGTPLDSESVRSKKTTLTIGTVLLGLLLVSIVFGVKQNLERTRRSQYEGQLKEAEHQFQESVSLAALDPDRSRDLFGQAKNSVNLLLDRKISDPGLTALHKKMDESEGKILGIYRSSPELFMDLSLFSQGFSGSTLAGSGDTVLVFDKENKKIISVDVPTKRGEVVVGPESVGDAQYLASYDERVFVAGDSGLFEVNGAKKKISDKFWQGEGVPYAYTGNIYLLDKGGGMIWRLNGSGNDFGTPQKWLGAGVSPSFSDVVSWTIDGNVWVVSGGGKVRRFSMGKQDDIGISGVTPNLTSAQSIFASDETKYVYILDKGNRRVVVLTKEADFYAQYSWENIPEVTGLVASEKAGKIILLAGSKLYSLEMKHL